MSLTQSVVTASRPQPNENNWIRTIPYYLANGVKLKSYAFANDEKDVQMACIADVFTNAESNVCLEVGVAQPVKLYVPLNDGQGPD